LYLYGTPFGPVFSRTVNVIPRAIPGDVPEYDNDILSDNISGEALTFTVGLPPADILIKNTGRQSWPSDDSVRLRGVGDYSYISRGVPNLGVDYEETKDFYLYIMAPRPGWTTLNLELQHNGVAFGDTYTRQIYGVTPTPTPTPPLVQRTGYVITGHVTDENGNGVSGVDTRVYRYDGTSLSDYTHIGSVSITTDSGEVLFDIGGKPEIFNSIPSGPYYIVSEHTMNSGYGEHDYRRSVYKIDNLTAANCTTHWTSPSWNLYELTFQLILKKDVVEPLPWQTTPTPTPTVTPTSTPMPTPIPGIDLRASSDDISFEKV
jgi:hypothetical protein